MRSDHEDRLFSTDTDVPPSTPASTAAAGMQETATPMPDIVEDVLIEEVSIDGMCGVY